jgi:teichuronic acid biosynthesis glycosyltransferase TuaG
MARVSVIVAAHNAQDHISTALQSLLHQTMTDWEAIVIDDASTDATLVRARSIKDPRIRVVSVDENIGSGAARNMAIGMASADFIAVLDADDICLPRRLDIQLAAFTAGGDVSVVGGQVAEFGEWGGPTLTRWPVEQNEIHARLAQFRMPIAHCAAMMRKVDVEHVGGYDEAARRAQDFALLLKLRDKPMVAVSDLLLLYRRDRPSPLTYAISSGRWGRAVVRQARTGRPIDGRNIGLPGSALADAKAVAQWAFERRRFWSGS